MNSVILSGRLTKDVDMRTSQNGTVFGRFTLAVDKDLSKEKKEAAKAAGKPTADFINCVVFNKKAEFAQQYLHKGSKIIADGTINTSTYTGQDGQKKYVTEIWVNNIEFCDSRAEQPAAQQPAAPAAPVAAPVAPAAPAAPPTAAPGYPEDDIPF